MSPAEYLSLCTRHKLTPEKVALATGVSVRTAEGWGEAGGRKTCPEPAARLLRLLYGEARLEDYRQ